jgi:small basic protein
VGEIELLKNLQLEKTLDIMLFFMIIVYFIGLLSFHPIPSEFEIYFEILLWAILLLLVVDLYIKFKKLDDWRVFLKKHWHEILMLGLIPLFSAFKMAKLSVKITKSLKTSKTGFKIFYKAKKVVT